MSFDIPPTASLLVDTNLLVLFVVGAVNRNRIATFKRTRQYTKADYDLLLRVLQGFKRLYTVAHVMAEVSNLSDLVGAEGRQARLVLKEYISLMDEAEMPFPSELTTPPVTKMYLVVIVFLGEGISRRASDRRGRRRRRDGRRRSRRARSCPPRARAAARASRSSRAETAEARRSA